MSEEEEMVSENISDASGLRVRYSTLINYVSFLYRFVVSIGYTTIVVRSLSVLDYGVFTSFIAFIALFTPVIYTWSMWSYRSYARRTDPDLVGTSVALSLMYSMIGAGLSASFIAMIPFFHAILIPSIIMAAVSTLSLILYNSLSFILSARKPYAIGYIGLITETTRFTAAYVFVRIMGMGLIGALMSVAVTYLVQFSFLLLFVEYYGLGRIKLVFSRKKLILIIKNSFIPVMRMITIQLKSSGERLLTGLVTLSPIYPAYFGVSYVSRRILSQSTNAFTRPISSRLLASPSRRDVEDVLRILTILSLFMGGVLIIYSKTALSIFKPAYVDAYPLMSLYAILSVLEVYLNYFSVIGTALDKSDMYYAGLDLRKSILYKNTRDYFVGTTTYFILASTLFTTVVFTLKLNPVIALLPFPLSAVIIYALLTIEYYRRSRSLLEYSIPWREVSASITGVAAIYIYAMLTRQNELIVKSITRQIIQVVYVFTMPLIVYVTVVLLLSPWTRRFIKSAIELYLGRGSGGRA